MDLERKTERAPDETVETRVERLLNAAVWDHPDLVRAKLTASPEKLARMEEILLDEPAKGGDGTMRETADKQRRTDGA